VYQCLIGITFIAESALVLSKRIYTGGPVLRSVKEYKRKKAAIYLSTLSRGNCAQNLVNRFRIACFLFKKHRSVYRQFQILLSVSNNISYCIVSTILFVGGALVLTNIYMIVKLHDSLPLLVNIVGVTFIIVYEVLAVLLMSLGALPYERSKLFKMFWRHVVSGIQLKQLESCKLLGFSAGPIRVAKARTVLDMNDVLLNAAASLVLMRS